MPADLFRRDGLPAVTPPPPAEPAFAARPRLLTLCDTLRRAAADLGRPRWNEPAVFFFDPKRQAELDAARPAPPDPFGHVARAVAAEMPALLEHVEVRHVARAIDGLHAATAALAAHCPAARDLAELLAVPDDEVFLVLAPAERTGVRLHVRGLAGVGQLAAALAPQRRAPFQLYAPAALAEDGTLPTGFAGCGHWLWPTQPLAAVPRIGGARVVLLGPAVVGASAEGDSRFPGLTAEAEVVQTLSPFQVAEELSKLAGRPVPVAPPVPATPVARAA